jgi:ADP-heptose:LPS heptosyltransferase
MILALRALGVGDLATAVPALRALRSAFPEEELALAAPTWLTPLVDLIGGVSLLVPCDGLSERPLPKPTIAVNLHGRGPQSHRLLAAAGPGELWGFRCEGFSDGPFWTFAEHEVHRWCRMLRWYGVPADPADLALRVPRPFLPGVTVVHPGAKAAARRWPPSRYAAVATALQARGHRVVVTGSAAEAPLCTEVAAAAGLPPDAVLAGATDVGDLAAVVAHARLVVCGDTGIAHLATAYRTPSIVLFGPMSPRWWGPPPGRRQHRALRRGTAVEAIRVLDVLAAVDGVLDAAAA